MQIIIAFFLLLAVNGANLRPVSTLVPGVDDIPFNSDIGEKLLLESSTHRLPFMTLVPHFVTQDTLGFCGPASAVMVLNALEIPIQSSLYKPFMYWTQDEWTKQACIERVVGKHYRYGIQLSQFKETFRCFNIDSEVEYMSNESPTEKLNVLTNAIQSGKLVIANFYRKELEEIGGGHYSPVVAYNARTDRFLILDVSRYKYPPIWVKSSQLYDSMNTRDFASNKSRGFLVVKNVPNRSKSMADDSKSVAESSVV